MILTQVTFHPIHYSFESVLMAVIASSLLLTVISLCLFSQRLMINTDYKLLSLFLMLTLLRFLVPLEFPFSINKNLPQSLSYIMFLIRHEYTFSHNISFSIWNIFEIVWLIGSSIQFARFIISHLRCRRYLVINGTDITGKQPYRDMLNDICIEHHKHNRFKILMLDDISTPMIYGIFSPYILIPAGMDLSRNDLYYALNHEASHHFHHDLLIKTGINILAVVYWWNPAVYVLEKKSDLLLEMRIDDHLTYNDRSTTACYLNCLINITEFTAGKTPVSPGLSLPFVKDGRSDLEKRFLLLCNRSRPKMYTLNVLLTIFIVGIYMASYIFIFEGYNCPAGTDSAGTNGTEYFLPLDTTYLIENENGTYDVYLDSPEMPDFYLETVDSLEYYDQGLKIYYLEKGNFK